MMFEEMVQLQLVMEDGGDGGGPGAKDGGSAKDADGGVDTARTDATEPAEAK